MVPKEATERRVFIVVDFRRHTQTLPASLISRAVALKTSMGLDNGTFVILLLP
jgi:hypothetical protein